MKLPVAWGPGFLYLVPKDLGFRPVRELDHECSLNYLSCKLLRHRRKEAAHIGSEQKAFLGLVNNGRYVNEALSAFREKGSPVEPPTTSAC